MSAAGRLALSQAEAQAAREEVVEAHGIAARAELETQGLGEAYNALEAQNYQLEAQLSDLRSQLQHAGALFENFMSSVSLA